MTDRKGNEIKKKKVTNKSKINADFIEAVKKVLGDDLSFVLTYQELCDEINSEMGEEYLKHDTLQQWISGNRGTSSSYYEEFLTLYKQLMIKMKKQLTSNMMINEKGWQRFSWLLERKYIDLNKIDQSKIDQSTEHKGEITITRKVI